MLMKCRCTYIIRYLIVTTIGILFYQLYQHNIIVADQIRMKSNYLIHATLIEFALYLISLLGLHRIQTFIYSNLVKVLEGMKGCLHFHDFQHF